MPSLIYDGPHPEVGLTASDGSRIVAEKGKKVEVDAETAKSLLEQSTWRKAGDKAPEKKESDS